MFPSADRKCNPSLLSLVQPGAATPAAPTPAPSVQWWDAQSIVGLLIFLFCTLYARYVGIFRPSGPASGPGWFR